MSIKNNNKKEIAIDSPEYVKKTKKTYAIKSILGFLGGGILGALGMTLIIYLKEHSLNPLETLHEFYPNIQVYVIPWIILIFMIVCMILGEINIKKGTQLVSTWDGEDDDHINHADSYLSKTSLIISVHTIVMFILFALATYNIFNALEKTDVVWPTFLAIIVYLISLFVNVSQQSRCVKLLKEYAPEKQGSIYDKKFQDIWYASCDEAERQRIGEASYKTYQFINKAFAFVLPLATITGMFFPIGILCAVFVGLLWLMMTCCYTYTCMQLEKGK